MRPSDLMKFFARPRAGIDFITLGATSEDVVAIHGMRDQLRGRLEVPRRLWRADAHWVTLHDPAPADLQLLLQERPETEIVGIEWYVDWLPLPGLDAMVYPLKAALRHSLFPARAMGSRFRDIRGFDAATGKVVRDPLAGRTDLTTRYFASRGELELLRLYVKILDDESPVPPRVRLELRLGRAGCQQLQVNRLCLLPGFIASMRTTIGRYFHVASAIKPKITRIRARSLTGQREAQRAAQAERRRVERNWKRFGAAWAMKHGYSVKPDVQANRMIQTALKDLRERLLVLTLSEKVADPAGMVNKWLTFYQPLTSSSAAVYRG